MIGENQARFFCEKRHQKTKEFLKLHFDEFVENYNFTQDNLENNKIIWTLWWQGYDNAPEIVKYCLDESTFDCYVQIPEYLKLKIKKRLYFNCKYFRYDTCLSSFAVWWNLD